MNNQATLESTSVLTYRELQQAIKAIAREHNLKIEVALNSKKSVLEQELTRLQRTIYDFGYSFNAHEKSYEDYCSIYLPREECGSSEYFGAYAAVEVTDSSTGYKELSYACNLKGCYELWYNPQLMNTSTAIQTTRTMRVGDIVRSQGSLYKITHINQQHGHTTFKAVLVDENNKPIRNHWGNEQVVILLEDEVIWA